MYKGQFAKWKWAKYNKAGKPTPIRPTRSAAGKKKNLPSRKTQRSPAWQTESRGKQQETLTPLPAQPKYFGDEERVVESALAAYAVMISNMCERETPWRTAAHDDNGDDGLLCVGVLIDVVDEDRSILERVRCAQDHFLSGRTQQGGDELRRAFLSIEAALSGDLTIDALWDCCLAVPQLALTTGWTDVLYIFVRYLHQYTSVRLPYHPIALVASSLHHLCRDISNVDNDQQQQQQQLARNEVLTTIRPRQFPDKCRPVPLPLESFVLRGWRVWIDTSTRVRGRHDDVTIHLKRGYVTVVDPGDPMARQVLGDFGRAMRASVRARGMAATTARTLQLERLLGRMYLPLFTPDRARAAEAVLAAVVARVEETVETSVGDDNNNNNNNHDGCRRPRGRWDYLDRYLVFSARHFMAGLAAVRGEPERAAEHAHSCLQPLSSSGRDLFWAQTSCLVESRLRTVGMHADADAVREARATVTTQGKFRRYLAMTEDAAVYGVPYSVLDGLE